MTMTLSGQDFTNAVIKNEQQYLRDVWEIYGVEGQERPSEEELERMIAEVPKEIEDFKKQCREAGKRIMPAILKEIEEEQGKGE